MRSGYSANMTPLSDKTLADLPKSVIVPTYARDHNTPGFAHIGVGGFHRAHQSVYVDDLMQRGLRDWSILGIGLLDRDKRMRDVFAAQDNLYTVVQRSAEGDKARVIGSHCGYRLGPDDPDAVLTSLAGPEIRIVTLTITEGGYNFDHATGEFNADNPDIVHDLSNPEQPISVFGYLAEALRRRKIAGTPPFTILSCDNLQHNGDIAKRSVTAFANLHEASLGDWIAGNVAFPNCMVDRITPQTTDSDRDDIQREYGIADEWPVVCEPFRQWVIEEQFCNGRPPLEDAGAQFTSDVGPYETIKLRLLNASHSAMGYLGSLMGYKYIADVIADREMRIFIKRMMDEEVTPLLTPLPGIDLAEYKETLLVRFANPKICDQVSRICLDGSAKMPKFILPSVAEQIERGGPLDLLSLAVAAWFRYLSGTDDNGNPITIEDPFAQTLQEHAKAGGADPMALLSLHELFGDLGQSRIFVDRLGYYLKSLYARGARAALSQAIG